MMTMMKGVVVYGGCFVCLRLPLPHHHEPPNTHPNLHPPIPKNTPDATPHPDWEKHLAKSEGLLRVGVVDCGNATNAQLCTRELGSAGAKQPFRAYPFGDEKEDEAKGFEAPAGAYQECGESVPDVLRRIGDGSNQMLVDQEVGGWVLLSIPPTPADPTDRRTCPPPPANHQPPHDPCPKTHNQKQNR